MEAMKIAADNIRHLMRERIAYQKWKEYEGTNSFNVKRIESTTLLLEKLKSYKSTFGTEKESLAKALCWVDDEYFFQLSAGSQSIVQRQRGGGKTQYHRLVYLLKVVKCSAQHEPVQVDFIFDSSRNYLLR